jgi:glucuronokinase
VGGCFCCRDQGIVIARENFIMSYDTNIPRQVRDCMDVVGCLAVIGRSSADPFYPLFSCSQVGLAGSSAIVTATLQCLMAFFNVSERDIPLHLQVRE